MILKSCLAGLQRFNLGGLVVHLDLEEVDGIGLLAEFGELACAFRLELLDLNLPRGHGEFRVQLVPVGLQLRHGGRRSLGRSW